MKKIVYLTTVCLLAGCSSIVDGTSQEITINTNPAGADCALEREGIAIARVNPTPGAATIKKTKHNIIIKCNKTGYHETSFFNRSDSAAATFGNVILGGGVGWAIDSASGADNKYTSPVTVTLAPIVYNSKGEVISSPPPLQNFKKEENEVPQHKKKDFPSQ